MVKGKLQCVVIVVAVKWSHCKPWMALEGGEWPMTSCPGLAAAVIVKAVALVVVAVVAAAVVTVVVVVAVEVAAASGNTNSLCMLLIH
jgi:hypothetical protein